MGTAAGGSIQDIGIIPRTIKEIFSQIEKLKDQKEFLVRASFLEIYNEDIHDLLELNRLLKYIFFY